MIVLTGSNTLQVLLGSAVVTESPWLSSWIEYNPVTYLPGSTTGLTAGTTPVEIAGATGYGQRVVKSFFLRNANSTSITVTIRYSSTSTRDIYSATLAAGECLVYSDTEGFKVLSVAGRMKSVAIVASSGSYARRTLYRSAGTFTHVYLPGVSAVIIECVGGGGGGAGAIGASSSISAGGGGGAGGYINQLVTTFLTTSTIVVGSAGAGGAAGQNPGQTGGDSSFTVGGTTYTAKGGTGRSPMPTGLTLNIQFYGMGQAGTSAADISYRGASGFFGFRSSDYGNYGLSGWGGSTKFGGGGASRAYDWGSGGWPCCGYGGGGAGAFSYETAASYAGGNGGVGLVVITEYY